MPIFSSVSSQFFVKSTESTSSVLCKQYNSNNNATDLRLHLPCCPHQFSSMHSWWPYNISNNNNNSTSTNLWSFSPQCHSFQSGWMPSKVAYNPPSASNLFQYAHLNLVKCFLVGHTTVSTITTATLLTFDHFLLNVLHFDLDRGIQSGF